VKDIFGAETKKGAPYNGSPFLLQITSYYVTIHGLCLYKTHNVYGLVRVHK